MRSALLVTIAFFLAVGAESEEFRFRYVEGEKYRILSTVDQYVYVNGIFSHRANILNRIAVTVEDVQDGSGLLRASFQTSEELLSGSRVYQWGTEYASEYRRDSRGRYEISDEYFMPVVRGVPTFPEGPVEPGDTWTATGSEAHDFRRQFNIPEAFRFPIEVDYEYQGEVVRDEKRYQLIAISYDVSYEVEQAYASALYPVRLSGFSDQKLYWDPRRGRPDAYEESYAFLFTLSNGTTIQYEGTAEADVIESSIMDRDLLVEEIGRDLAERGVEDASVAADEDGVTITLENIQFPPDSDFLVPSEREKLDQIGEILLRYPERDILITGHTALAGTPEGRRQLSEARAAVVGEYLYDRGVRERERMFTRGMGARDPIAGNASEAGMRKNRRVEITILEN
jgi:outer membrane protein OmpA-like peptidoglycan-associated protein